MSCMKSLRLAFFVVAAGVMAGCASTTVTEQESRGSGEAIPRPSMIHVYPFAASLADVPSWSAAAIRYTAPSEPQTPEEMATGRELGALVAQDLVAEIGELGLAATVGSDATKPRIDDLLIIGYFEAVEEGSSTKRVLLGFGSGKAELNTAVEGYQMTTLGPRLIGAGKLESSGSSTPGVAVSLALLAATSNPIGLIINSTGKVVRESTGKEKIEGAARRTAEKIAEQLELRFRERGWIE